jgi:glyoxylase-like metal-dependent hydrolase (beta-lactamase superfamily II)
MDVPVAAYKDAVEAPFVTRRLSDGDRIELGETSLSAVHTPGHASAHLCYYLDAERAVFAGDVVAGFGTVVIAPPDGNMQEYFATLERLRSMGLARIYPGHGPVIDDAPAKLDEYVAHRRERERQVVDAVAAGAAEIPAMVKRIYADVPEVLHPMAERSVLAHLEMLEAEGRVACEDDHWSLA